MPRDVSHPHIFFDYMISFWHLKAVLFLKLTTEGYLTSPLSRYLKPDGYLKTTLTTFTIPHITRGIS